MIESDSDLTKHVNDSYTFNTYKQAINSSKNKKWTKAMQKKISDLKN